MPCHVRSASKLKIRRSPSQFPPRAALLDLGKPAERQAHDFIRRFSSGRWPEWRLLGMRRSGQTLYLAVEWLRVERDRPETHSVVEVALDRIAVCWCYHRTAAAARKALRAETLTQSTLGGAR